MKRVVVVTGASSGIGKETSESFLRDGFHVIAVDRDTQETGAPCENLTWIGCDLTRPQSIRTLFRKIYGLGVIPDILVNCAGIREIESVLDLSLETWNEVFQVNLTAPFLLSKEFCRARVKNGGGGNIVNVASVSSVMAEPQRAAYVASKHGLVGLTKQMAMEFGAMGIRVNAISPGVVETPLTQAYFHDAQKCQLIRSNHALHRWAQVPEIVKAIRFLTSDDASFVTGSNLVVDGGWTAGKAL